MPCASIGLPPSEILSATIQFVSRWLALCKLHLNSINWGGDWSFRGKPGNRACLQVMKKYFAVKNEWSINQNLVKNELHNGFLKGNLNHVPLSMPPGHTVASKPRKTHRTTCPAASSQSDLPCWDTSAGHCMYENQAQKTTKIWLQPLLHMVQNM
jgi:hypothetical protein